MNLNYAVFRSEPILTINDLAQIGSHNKREKKAYNSNPDIDIEKSKDNIELVPLSDKYVKGFYNVVKDVAKRTPREDELFDYANVPDQYRTIITLPLQLIKLKLVYIKIIKINNKQINTTKIY